MSEYPPGAATASTSSLATGASEGAALVRAATHPHSGSVPSLAASAPLSPPTYIRGPPLKSQLSNGAVRRVCRLSIPSLRLLSDLPADTDRVYLEAQVKGASKPVRSAAIDVAKGVTEYAPAFAIEVPYAHQVKGESYVRIIMLRRHRGRSKVLGLCRLSLAHLLQVPFSSDNVELGIASKKDVPPKLVAAIRVSISTLSMRSVDLGVGGAGRGSRNDLPRTESFADDADTTMDPDVDDDDVSNMSDDELYSFDDDADAGDTASDGDDVVATATAAAGAARDMPSQSTPVVGDYRKPVFGESLRQRARKKLEVTKTKFLKQKPSKTSPQPEPGNQVGLDDMWSGSDLSDRGFDDDDIEDAPPSRLLGLSLPSLLAGRERPAFLDGPEAPFSPLHSATSGGEGDGYADYPLDPAGDPTDDEVGEMLSPAMRRHTSTEMRAGEQLISLLSREDLPPYIGVINARKRRSSMLAEWVRRDADCRLHDCLIPVTGLAEVSMVAVALVQRLQNASETTNSAVGIVLAGADGFVGDVFRALLAAIDKRHGLWSLLRFYLIPLSSHNDMAHQIGSADERYASSFLSDSWQSPFNSNEPISTAQWFLLRETIDAYLDNANASYTFPIGEASMVTFSQGSSHQVVVPFIKSVNIVARDAGGSAGDSREDLSSSSVDLVTEYWPDSEGGKKSNKISASSLSVTRLSSTATVRRNLPLEARPTPSTFGFIAQPVRERKRVPLPGSKHPSRVTARIRKIIVFSSHADHGFSVTVDMGDVRHAGSLTLLPESSSHIKTLQIASFTAGGATDSK